MTTLNTHDTNSIDSYANFCLTLDTLDTPNM